MDQSTNSKNAHLYIIGRFCLSRKMSTLPNGLKSTSTSTSRSVCMVFHGSRLVFHGSWSVFMVFHGSRLVFHGSMSVSMVFHGSRLVFHGSRSVLMVFRGSRLFFYGSR